MQFIYAFGQAERSDYQMALDLIGKTFSHDLNSMVVPDLKKLEGNKKLSSLLFEENYLNGQVSEEESAEENVPAEVYTVAANAIDFYHTQRRKDMAYLGKQMLNDAEKIYDHYIGLLLLLIEIAAYVQAEETNLQHRQIKPQPASKRELKFEQNKVVAVLRNHSMLETEAIRKGIGWTGERNFIKELYKEAIKNDPAYLDYTNLVEATFEDDKKIVSHIIKNIIFKHEFSENFFQMRDLNWLENRNILKSMVSKTIKSIEEKMPDTLELLNLSPNWEDDKEFFADLYKYTIENDARYEEIVSDKIKNWDAERVAALDKILLKMAMAEMLHFPSIPVKVTINEYIELSKVYSTPKSKQFVNGILDAIVVDLTAKGVLKKVEED